MEKTTNRDLNNLIAFAPQNNRQEITGIVNAVMLSAIVGSVLSYINWPVLPSSRVLTSVSLLSGMAGLATGSFDSTQTEIAKEQIPNVERTPAGVLLYGVVANFALFGINGCSSHLFDTTLTVRGSQLLFASLVSFGTCCQIARAIKFSIEKVEPNE